MIRRFFRQRLLDPFKAAALLSIANLSIAPVAAQDTTNTTAGNLVEALLGAVVGKKAPVEGPLADLDILLVQTKTLLGNGDLVAAEANARKALAFAKTISGSDQAVLIAPLINLTTALIMSYKNSEAETVARWAYDISKKTFGEGSIYTIMVRDDLSRIYRATGRFTEAESISLQVIADAQKKSGTTTEFTIGAINGLGALYMGQGRAAEAEPLFARALELSRKSRGLNDPNTLGILANLGAAKALQQKYAEAGPLLVEAAAGMERVSGVKSQKSIIVNVQLAGLLFSEGKVREAEQLLAKARLQSTDPNIPKSLSFTIAMEQAGLFIATKRPDLALPILTGGVTQSALLFGQEHPMTISLNALLAQGRLEK